jgi:hypothetical protein
MGKRKVFLKTDLVRAQAEVPADIERPEASRRPRKTVIEFGRSASVRRTFDFAPWYGVGIDAIVLACQQQIERFLDKRDADVEVTTIAGYCTEGLRHFLSYLTAQSAAMGKPLTLADITRDMVDGYLLYLRDGGWSTGTQHLRYSVVKSVLLALSRRGLFALVDSGDDATFPSNPFPGSGRHSKGEAPLPRTQRQAFAAAVKAAVVPLLTDDAEPTGTLLAYALLIVALHTGRNTTPLLEMPVDCLRDHPKQGTAFLVLHKRRGHTTYKVALRSARSADRIAESTLTLRPTVTQLIQRVIELTESLRQEAPAALRKRLWVYRSRRSDDNGRVTALTFHTLSDAIGKLVADHQLEDAGGQPLRLNVSRLRKTFVNRVHEILEGDLVATAVAAGNQPRITERYYLRPGEEAQRNWHFIGQCLVDELRSGTLGATERTPVGRCSDIKMGDFAPKHGGALCQNFLNCLRCRNYVVTGDDLWRLFSFYWRVLREQPRTDPHRWRQQLAHIPRLIERDVIVAGLTNKVFTSAQVDAARERARHDPHPFWAGPTILSDLEALE